MQKHLAENGLLYNFALESVTSLNNENKKQ